ncbi:DUF4135 domain-containing protein [Paenibacillus sp. FSL W8-0426]|uniref:DUF4135 domain-containing protein n=2 Tax=Paenibacillus TaxID=44249 RepID=UPI0030D962F9
MPQEISCYDYRYGGYVPLLHVPGSIDIHFENIIDYGEYPLFIEMETLFSNEVEQRRLGRYPFMNRRLEDIALGSDPRSKILLGIFLRIMLF